MWFQEARPSPERLDAQIRHLVHSRDTATQNILEQNKALLEQIKAVVDGLKENKLVMEEIKVCCVVWSALLISLILRSFDIALLLLVLLGFWTSSVLFVFRVWWRTVETDWGYLRLLDPAVQTVITNVHRVGSFLSSLCVSEILAVLSHSGQGID